MIGRNKWACFWLLPLCFTALLQAKQWSGQVALLADVHFSDVYADWGDSDFEGIKHPEKERFVSIRTMTSQIHSTRLFNENYFAFKAALDDIVSKGIRYVLLVGDFSDDGQPVHLRGLSRMLRSYESEHGLVFFATTGNHDPVRPFVIDGGKKDYLGEGGKAQPVMSAAGMYQADQRIEHPVVIAKSLEKAGYLDVMEHMRDFGFFPQQNFMYWETPFSGYEYADYDFETAAEEACLEQRHFEIQGSECSIPDASYLVEPESGLWILAIDGNMYMPQARGEQDGFSGSSIGYNQTLKHKQHLFDWIASVTERARTLGKSLIVFSHYPVVEFNDGAHECIDRLLVGKKMDMHRCPDVAVAEQFLKAGVSVHFGGHMHINDTGVYESDSGELLLNVQIPSLAAYIPAFKTLEITSEQRWHVNTVVLEQVPDFKEFFPLYRTEHRFLSRGGLSTWDLNMLDARNYREFTMSHLQQLVTKRHLPSDWPTEFVQWFSEQPLVDLFHEISRNEDESIADTFSEISDLTGSDLFFDLYRFRSADRLAIKDVGWERLALYRQFHVLLSADDLEPLGAPFLNPLKDCIEILHAFSHATLADGVNIEFNGGSIVKLEESFPDDASTR